MKRLHTLTVVALLAGATSAGAQVTLEFQNGRVNLSAQNATMNQILAEWARRGRTTIVNGERVPGPPVTLELQDVTEQQALEVLLRGVSGYLVGGRENAVAGASSFDRIYILPTSSRPTNAATLQQQPQQALQLQDDFNDDDPVPGGGAARGANPAAGARLPRDVVQPGIAGRPAAALDDDDPDPESRPAPAPSNPFGVQPGTNRPGVITPAPAPNRPNNQ